MNKNPIDLILQNYLALIERVDDHIHRVEKKYENHIACRKGCDACCKFLSLFPVEALAISQAFSKLPQNIKTKVIKRLETHKTECPLLIDRACVLYSARPVICRTHGYPIFMEDENGKTIDFCPKNFKGVTSFPSDSLLSVEQLNATLLAVNNRFLECIETKEALPNRLPISKALFMTDEM